MLDPINQKDKLVVMHNNLIRGKFNYGLAELRFILTAISLIKPDDEEFKKYQLTAKQFSELLDSKYKDEYSRIKKFGIDLASKVIVLENQRQSGFKIRNWFHTFDYDRGVITFSFNEDLKPYLLQLQREFTSFSLGACLRMRSKYGMIVFMLAKSWESRGYFDMPVEGFKEFLGITGKAYDRFYNLKAKVLDVALEEINNTGDIFISYTAEKTGKKVTKLCFTILRGSESGTITVGAKPKRGRSRKADAVDSLLLEQESRSVVDLFIQKRKEIQSHFDIMISSGGKDPYSTMQTHLKTGMRSAGDYINLIKQIFESDKKEAGYWRCRIFTIQQVIQHYAAIELQLLDEKETFIIYTDGISMDNAQFETFITRLDERVVDQKDFQREVIKLARFNGVRIDTDVLNLIKESFTERRRNRRPVGQQLNFRLS
ncbi:replication initiation protein [Sulfuricurvum sp.]|uniref:replication initiation protein n=1 Tax=Sulfuricurvum sp. TaxID=2025608 RepID=UPI00262255BB|nr:replication initiation protein [Sulfuricurvum sp.]MDD3597437.1 replication initiation protein [Sulfuricurvum sp.]